MSPFEPFLLLVSTRRSVPHCGNQRHDTSSEPETFDLRWWRPKPQQKDDEPTSDTSASVTAALSDSICKVEFNIFVNTRLNVNH